MKVVTKVAAGSILLVLLLVGVLVYQSLLMRSAVATSSELSRNQYEAAEKLFRLIQTLDEISEVLAKTGRTRDPQYARRVLDRVNEFNSGLNDLRLIPGLTVGEEEEREILSNLWRELWTPEMKRAVEAADALPQVPEEAPPPAEQETVDWDLILATAEELPKVRDQAEALVTVTGTAVRTEVREAVRTSKEARRISSTIVGLALLLCTLVIFLTVRSIREPLKELATATGAVADGQFSYRMETSRRDEFSAVAADFNSMVEKLSQLDQMKKDFVAHVSHELKNPLVTLQETNQLLSEEIPGPLNEKQHRLIELNLHSGRRLSTMLSNLLDLSSLEAGAMMYDFKSVDIIGLLQFMMKVFATRARDKDLELRFDLPRSGDQVMVRCDRDRITQIVENLLDNAVKYTPNGRSVVLGVQPPAQLPRQMPRPLRERVLKGRRDGGPFVLVTVTDDGPGIPDDQKEAIFRKFHQVSASRRKRASGVGLGLAICREIAEAHGGAIWVSGDEGTGSRFSLLLPVDGPPAGAKWRKGGTHLGEGAA